MEKKPDIIQSFVKLGCKCSNNGYHLYDIQKWLREVKNIHIYVDFYDKYVFAIKKHNEQYYNRYGSFEMDMDTYEEALEAGIWESYFIIAN
jgi:hypothetical protein